MNKSKIFSAFLVICVAAGCAKELVERDPASENALGTQTFTATIESPEDIAAPSVKSFDGTLKAFQFELDNEIAISDGTNTSVFVATAVTDDAVTFTLKAGETALAAEGVTYKAYYPVSIAPGKSGVEGQTGSYMMQQQINANGPIPDGGKINNAASYYEANPMYAESTTDELHFSNLCGLIRINVAVPEDAADIAISQIIMESYDNNLFGPFQVTDGKMVVSSDAGYGRIAVKNTNAKWISAVPTYYIAVPEGTYNDFEFMVINNKALYQHYRKKASAAAMTIERNKVYTLNLTIDDLRTDLTDNKETSNCYVVVSTASTPFVFKATKGNDKEFIDDVDSTGLVWKAQVASTKTSAQLKTIIVDNKPTYKNGYIYFNTLTGQGNAVIAAYKDGEIVWSWHLWVVGAAPSDQTYPSGKVIMDRNIGAFSVSTSGSSANGAGLLYQWGRKDPFPGRGANSNKLSAQYGKGTVINTDGPVTLVTANAHPNVYYSNTSAVWTNDSVSWDGEAKSQTDPCPQGYRVWDNTAWGASITKSKFSTNVQTVDSSGTQLNAGFLYSLGGDASAYYPTNGQMNNATGLYSAGTTQYRSWFRTISGGKTGFYNLNQTGTLPSVTVNQATAACNMVVNSSYGMGVRCEKIQ